MRCLNCDAPYPALARFCARCGQRTDTKRLKLRDIWRELMHAVTNVERSPLALARALLTRPGASPATTSKAGDAGTTARSPR